MNVSRQTTIRVMCTEEDNLLVPFGSGEQALLAELVVTADDGDEPRFYVHARGPLKNGGYRRHSTMWGVGFGDLPPQVQQALAANLLGVKADA